VLPRSRPSGADDGVGVVRSGRCPHPGDGHVGGRYSRRPALGSCGAGWRGPRSSDDADPGMPRVRRPKSPSGAVERILYSIDMAQCPPRLPSPRYAGPRLARRPVPASVTPVLALTGSRCRYVTPVLALTGSAVEVRHDGSCRGSALVLAVARSRYGWWVPHHRCVVVAAAWRSTAAVRRSGSRGSSCPGDRPRSGPARRLGSRPRTLSRIAAGRGQGVPLDAWEHSPGAVPAC
jgi:hypothetical protein